jgi:hypothetical protein
MGYPHDQETSGFQGEALWQGELVTRTTVRWANVTRGLGGTTLQDLVDMSFSLASKTESPSAAKCFRLD